MKVIVLWTATTERFTSIEIGLNDTADNLLASIHVSTDQTISILSFISFDVVSLQIVMRILLFAWFHEEADNLSHCIFAAR